ncbi:helix-turn-helix transcriptional regulator [Tomitella fengzijianii]|uniref:AAA family ATPase n=1 Tax=Tomitella fengzijianii TaxID=2597660 RepID=A0A516X622_9ACTN|nr:LuxR family transcriptional regulator [Tomitella fengzijianii]QDQ98490.1 AAA family ATPase [Tomitella fengzijianii]
MGIEEESRATILDTVLRGIGATLADGPGGGPAAFLITGSGGSGKTHLLHLLAGLADAPDVDLRFASGEPASTGRPGAVLAQLFPELESPVDRAFGGVQDEHSTAPPGPIRHALALVAELARERPLAVLLDDAHLADSLSLSVLTRLAGTDAEVRPAMVIARRGIPARGALTMLAGAPTVREIVLAPLTDDEILALARARLGAPPGPTLAAALMQTGGNPAHANRILDWVRFRERLHPVPGSGAVDARLEHDEMVEILSRSVDTQLSLLDPDALQTVRLVAVWNKAVTAAEIGLARRQHPSEFVGGIDAAVGAGILVWEGEHIRFGSRVAAEAVRAGLAPTIRELMLAAVGAAADVRAHGESGVGVDATASVLRVQTSLQIGAQLPRPPRPRARTITTPAGLPAVLARVTMLSDAGRLYEAYELAERALPSHTEPTERLTLLFSMLSFATLGGRVERARTVLRAMHDEPLPRESAAWLAEIETWLDAMTGNPPRGGTLTALAEIDDAPPGLTGYRTARAIGLTLAGDCVGALALLDAVLDSNAASQSWLGADSPESAAWPLWVTRFAYGPSYTLTRAPVDSVRDNRLVNRWLGPFRQSVIAESHMACGELDIASMLLDDSLAEARRIESGWMSTAVADRALIDVHRGAAPAALMLIAQWRECGFPDRFGLRDVDVAEAEARLALGESDAVSELAGQTWTASADDGHRAWMVHRAPMLIRQARLAGDDALVAAIADGTAAMLPGFDAPALRGPASLTAAVAAQDQAAAERSAAEFQSVGDQLGELAALEEAACLAAATGRAPAALGIAQRAAALASRIGSVATGQRLHTRLRESGIEVPRAGAGVSWPGSRGSGGVPGPAGVAAPGAGSLTRAENRVSRLVAQGMTSPQIAERLGISPRTVQTHISHVLTKLGLSTRAEIAAFISSTRR